MRFYPLLDFQYVVAAILAALGVLGMILLFFRTYHQGERREEENQDTENYPEGLKAAHNPIPPIILVLMVALVAWVFHYVYHIGIRGPAF